MRTSVVADGCSAEFRGGNSLPTLSQEKHGKSRPAELREKACASQLFDERLIRQKRGLSAIGRDKQCMPN
jgi:hypothetical protein